jgi:IclR family acetate operon transcriptional repressor
VKAPSGAQAVERAARLVREVVETPAGASLTVLAEATKLPKSTAARMLLALERQGLVARDDSGRYHAGEVFVRFAWRRPSEGDLVELARPFLERLGELTGETVNLGVVRGSAVEQVAQVDSRYVLGATNWVGRSEPLHCTALGKALLAAGGAVLPPGRLERLTERTVTSRSALAAELRAVRERGYAVADEELEPGLVAIAAPVFRAGGAAVAAISVSGPASRLGPGRWAEVGMRCAAEAGALSELLGHRPAGTGREGAA